VTPFAHKYEPNAADSVNYEGETGVNSRRKSYRDESGCMKAPFHTNYTQGCSRLERPSVTESDAEALVAQPVHITVKRDIGSGPRDG